MNDPWEYSAYSKYDYVRERTWQAWKALNEVDEAIEFGFTDNLWADMYEPINLDEAKEHVKNVERKWAEECTKMGQDKYFDGAPALSQMPDNAQLRLHQKLKYLRE